MAIALGGGYVLFSKAYVASVRVADVTARAPAEIATVTTEQEEPRDKLEGVVAPSIAIAPSVAAEAVKSGDYPVIAQDVPVGLPERDVEVAKAIEDFRIPIDRADANSRRAAVPSRHRLHVPPRPGRRRRR